MKKKIMEKWVKALRSGKYQRTEGNLKEKRKEKTSHCCLGVLCELYNTDRKKNKKKTLKEREYGKNISFDDELFELPKVVKDWAGMYNTNGSFITKTPQVATSIGQPYSSLAELNDSGSSFKVIATIIEDQWENL